MRIRAIVWLLPLFALLLAGCDLAALGSRVGNPKTGFTVQFPEAKWRLDAGALIKMPSFVNGASRFHCELDRCGRRAVGIGVYGNTERTLGARELPRHEDVVVLLDTFLNLRGTLRTDSLRLLTIKGRDTYQVTLTLRDPMGAPVFTRANIVFYENRFLFWGVSSKPADRDMAESLLDEISQSLKVPGPAA